MVVSIATKTVQGVVVRLPSVRVVPEIVVQFGILLILPAARLEIELREKTFVQVVGGEPVVPAGDIEQLVGIVGGIVAAFHRDLRQGTVQDRKHMDGCVAASHVELIPVIEGDGRDILERVGEHRPERDVTVNHPLRVDGPGRDALQPVVADITAVTG